MRKKPTEKEVQEYIIIRTEEALKEMLMKDPMLVENRILREIFKAGYFAGVGTQNKIMKDVGAELIGKEKG